MNFPHTPSQKKKKLSVWESLQRWLGDSVHTWESKQGGRWFGQLYSLLVIKPELNWFN